MVRESQVALNVETKEWWLLRKVSCITRKLAKAKTHGSQSLTRRKIDHRYKGTAKLKNRRLKMRVTSVKCKLPTRIKWPSITKNAGGANKGLSH